MAKSRRKAWRDQEEGEKFYFLSWRQKPLRATKGAALLLFGSATNFRNPESGLNDLFVKDRKGKGDGCEREREWEENGKESLSTGRLEGIALQLFTLNLWTN